MQPLQCFGTFCSISVFTTSYLQLKQILIGLAIIDLNDINFIMKPDTKHSFKLTSGVISLPESCRIEFYRKRALAGLFCKLVVGFP